MLGVASTRHRTGFASTPQRTRFEVLFAYGFRPFFLLAGLYGALVVPLWLGGHAAGWI
jgi:uncharacterized protein involved in response to NO